MKHEEYIMIKSVIFDMDGTLLNTITDLTIATNYALKETGHAYGFSENEIKLCFGWALRLDMIKALALSKNFSKKEIELAGVEIPIHQLSITEKEIADMQEIFVSFYQKSHSPHTKPYDGIVPLLDRLQKEGILLAVASNKDDFSVKELTNKLFPSYFSIAKGCHPGLLRKPDPSMIFEIMNDFGTKKENVVYIGDSEVDILTGINGHFPTISVTWGFRTKEFLKNHKATYIVDNTNELYQLIQKL